MKWNRTAAMLAALLAVASLPSSANTADAAAQGPKWGAHIDLEAKWGNRRSLGDIGLFAPLWQDRNSLFFTDLRGRFDNDDGREGNFGFGFRRMSPNGWNPGVYGYYDARRSPAGNLFQQFTLGAELLSPDWDLRANLYLPFGNREHVIGGGAGGSPFAQFANGTIQIVTPGGQLVERSLRGVDGEIGWRLPVFPLESMMQLRAYAGAFWFDGENLMSDIAGPRGRLELSFDNLPYLNEGSRFTLGVESQHDNVRGTNNFVLARLRIPLSPVKSASSRLTPQERRMTERVVRDVDVVVGKTQKGSGIPTVEDAINAYNDLTVTDVVQVDASGGHAALLGQIAALDGGSIIIANGAFPVAAITMPKAGQTLLGGGAQLPLKGAVSGTQVTFTAPGAAATLTGSLTSGIVTLANASDSVVGGLNLTNNAANGGYGVYSVFSPGAVIFGNTISTPLPADTPAISNLGIYVHQDSHNSRVLNNTITTAGGSSHGIFVQVNTGTSVTGNTVTTTGTSSSGIYFATANNGTATQNTITSSGSGIRFHDSSGGTASGNSVQATGAGTSGLLAQNSDGLTVSNNTFGPLIAGHVINVSDNSTIAAGSTGNIDNSAPAANRCTGDGTGSGTVSFTAGTNCAY